MQEAVPQAVRVRVAQTVIHLRRQHQAHIDPLLAALPADQQRAIQMLVEQRSS